MKIDWTKQRCWVCGGKFEPGHTILTDEKTGKVRRIRRMICVKCGDHAFSPEQYLAGKYKQVAAEMTEELRRE